MNIYEVKIILQSKEVIYYLVAETTAIKALKKAAKMFPTKNGHKIDPKAKHIV